MINSGINLSLFSDAYNYFGNPGSLYLSFGKIINFDDDSICYDVPNLPGSSGGAVFKISNMKELEVVAIHVMGSTIFNNSCGLRMKFIEQEKYEKYSWFRWLNFLGWFFIDLLFMAIPTISIWKIIQDVVIRIHGISQLKLFLYGLLGLLLSGWMLVSLTFILNYFGLCWVIHLIVKRVLIK